VRGLAALLLLAACGDDAEPCDLTTKLCAKLSATKLFADLPSQTPADDVIPFTVASPLFSDYTDKDRFVRLPDGAAMAWSQDDAFDIPVGSVLVKTFGYPGRLLETRLLVHGEDGWSGAAYVYDDAQRDADLAVAGTVLETERASYVVPNANQCKSCHAEHDRDTVLPLGPKARHWNVGDQLPSLIASGALTGAPDMAAWPRGVVFDDPATGTVEERARAWLDISCGHCHNPTGAARTSGLFLDIATTNPSALGICKAPVASGGGSGGLDYDIVPGMPDQSILVFRIESTEAAIKMPEIGRNLVHAEGAALIREWISGLSGSCAVAVDSRGDAGQ